MRQRRRGFDIEWYGLEVEVKVMMNHVIHLVWFFFSVIMSICFFPFIYLGYAMLL